MNKRFAGRTHSLEARAKISAGNKGKVLSLATREKIRLARTKEPMSIDEFWKNVHKDDGCWEWQGPRFWNNYGRVIWNGRGQNAHRIAYEITFGELPSGKIHVCHHCDNPPCCNPAHLFPGTARDNQMDSSRKGRNTKGRKQTPDVIENRIAPLRGRKRTPETCAKISAKARGRYHPPLTMEHAEKISRALRIYYEKKKVVSLA
jgi:hypothetical protein